MSHRPQNYGPSLAMPGDDQYVNFGVPLQHHRRDRLSWWLDTWYVEIFGEVGTIPLGDGPLTGADGIADFLVGRLRESYQALSHLVRVRPSVRIAYKQIPRRLHNLIVDVSAEDIQHLLENVHQRLLTPTDTFVNLSTHFDVHAWVRNRAGQQEDRWLNNSARLFVQVHAAETLLQESPVGTKVPWHASLDIDVVSLFKKNNSEQLQTAREAWKQLRRRDPNADVFVEQMNRSPIVTLADPPHETPFDNLALHELNAPRLREAVARWEQVVGRTFAWRVGLDS